jgi:hypothetical protein
MAFTATDLSNIEAAIVKVAVGTRAIECTIDGDTVIYQKCDLADMFALRDRIRQEIASTAADYKRSRIAVTTKGY